MQDLLNSPAGSLVKTSLVDFPERLAAAVFLKGCPIRCPYCYNIALIGNTECSEAFARENEFSTLEEIFEHLEKRKNVLSGLAISGGEPLENPRLIPLIKKAREMGYKIKLDTNGLFPQKLRDLCADETTRPDYIAMDIKTSPGRYGLFCPDQKRIQDFARVYEKNIMASISIISAYPTECREFRTVLVPPLVGEDDIKNIAEIIPQGSRWYLAQFQNQSCLDPEYCRIEPYSTEEIESLLESARKIHPAAQLR
ncbi:MAG: anaerobic ribonucleoside-triphosphate reductase activating protein [Treponema sp.]|nr:anaerobic ribonucleoside-triphosphate reductase activating protein [Treponema sp.]